MKRIMEAIPVSVMAILFAATVACGTNPVENESLRPASVDESKSVQVTWHDPIEVASGGGHRGPWRMNRSEWDFVDDGTVAVNEQGFIGVAWAYHEQQDVLFQLYGPDGAPRHEEPVNVSRSSSIFSWLPRMILADGDDPDELAVYLLWQEIVFSGGSHGGEIFFAKSTDGGATFSRPINLSNTTAGAGKGRLTSQNWHNGSYDIVKGPGGELYIAWTEYEGNLWFSRSTDDGESFSDPLHIDGGDDRGEYPARGPALAVDENNRIYLAWTLGEREDADINLATSDDGGESFDSPRPVHERGGHADAPKLAIDSNGTVHLAYMQSPDGPFRQYHVRYAHADRDELDFSEPRDISETQPGRYASIGFPALHLDGADNFYLTWELFPSARGRPMALGFTHSTDGGETFTTPIVVPGTGDRTHGFNGSQQGLLMNKLAVNRDGAISIVNSTFRSGEASRVWLIRGEIDRAHSDAAGDESE